MFAVITSRKPEPGAFEMQQILIMIKPDGFSHRGIGDGFQQVCFSTAVGAQNQAATRLKAKFTLPVTAKILQFEVRQIQDSAMNEAASAGRLIPGRE